MAILVDKSTKVICQGITGSQGTFHTKQAKAYGTKIVGGVTPGKGGTKHPDDELADVPLFDTVREAQAGDRRRRDSAIYVPPPFAADAILEAIDAGIALIVAITEGIPVLDMVKVKRALEGSGSRLHRAQLPRRADAERLQDRHHAGQHLQAGPRRHRLALGHADVRGGEADVGRRARPVDRRRHRRRSGQGHRSSSTCSTCSSPTPKTDSIIMIGEIGGSAEEEAAEFIKSEAKRKGRSKPMAGFIAGVTAPPGRRMGHAGAIISGGKGKAEDKLEAMRSAGIAIAASPAALGTTLMDVLNGQAKKPQTKHAKLAK